MTRCFIDSSLGWGAVLASALLVACVSEAHGTDAGPDAAAGVDAGFDAGADAGADSGAGGDAGGGMPFACGDSEPWMGGFERCETGDVHRPAAETCPSSVPRSDPIPSYLSDYDECEYDSECSDLAYGHCAQHEGGWARGCVAGCIEDADCDSGEICYCTEPVGRCVPATCKTDADCQPGYDCSLYEAHPGCWSVAFACHGSEDSCGGNMGCEDFSPNATFCTYLNGSFGCTIEQCTTP